ncbi:MAG: c-type cytochrome [Bryobacteraceae bacterium]
MTRGPWLTTCATLLLLPALAAAHEPITTKLTWTQEISRIVFKRCLSCHAAGSNIPLATYDEARPWAKAIRDEVLERRMPPWGAVKGFGEFRDDPSLTQPEIDRLVQWVEGGAPKGDDIYLPSTPPAPARQAGRPALHRVIPIRVTESTLVKDETAAGIRPDRLDDRGWMQITATLPDGEVRPLIWIRDWRRTLMRTYYFREPLALPKGTRLALYSSGTAQASLAVATTRPRGTD